MISLLSYLFYRPYLPIGGIIYFNPFCKLLSNRKIKFSKIFVVANRFSDLCL